MKEDQEQIVYRTGTQPNCMPERTRVYEAFVKLGTCEYVPGRKFDRNFVRNVIPKLVTPLADPKIEARMKGKQDDDAYAQFNSISQIYDDVELALNKIDVVSEEVINDASKVINKDGNASKLTKSVEKELSTAKDKRLQDIMDDDRNRSEVVDNENDDEPDSLTDGDKAESKKDDAILSKKLGYNRFMIADPWATGAKRLADAKLKETREGARKRLVRNIRAKREINKSTRRAKDAPETVLGHIEEVAMPSYANRIMEMYKEFYE